MSISRHAGEFLGAGASGNWLRGVGLVLLFWLLDPSLAFAQGAASSEPANPGVAEPGIEQIEAIQGAFQRAIEKVRPSIVSVYLRSQQGMVNSVVAGPDGRLIPSGVGSGDLQPAGFGSGFVIRKEGLVATCYHVVRGATRPGSGLEIIVQLHNGVMLPATIIGADPRSDLAVVRLLSQKPLDLVPFRWVTARSFSPVNLSLPWAIRSEWRRPTARSAPLGESSVTFVVGRLRCLTAR